MAEDPSYSEPPAKKQKMERSPKYHFVEKHNISLPPDDCRLGMDEFIVSRDEDSLYTDGCISCIAVIIVAKMDDDETWHGLYHGGHLQTTTKLNRAMKDMEEDIEEQSEHEIIGVDYYIVINPQYKSGYNDIVNEAVYEINIFYPERDPEIAMIDTTKQGKNTGSMDVKVSSGLIEVDYTQAERS